MRVPETLDIREKPLTSVTYKTNCTVARAVVAGVGGTRILRPPGRHQHYRDAGPKLGLWPPASRAVVPRPARSAIPLPARLGLRAVAGRGDRAGGVFPSPGGAAG